MEFKTLDSSKASIIDAYGIGAEPLLNMLSFQYARVMGKEPAEWTFRLYSNGLLVPVPTMLSHEGISEVQVRQIFCKALSRTADALQSFTQGGELPEGVLSACERAETFCSLSLAT